MPNCDASFLSSLSQISHSHLVSLVGCLPTPEEQEWCAPSSTTAVHSAVTPAAEYSSAYKKLVSSDLKLEEMKQDSS